jgi:hypothetical protein
MIAFGWVSRRRKKSSWVEAARPRFGGADGVTGEAKVSGSMDVAPVS